MRWATWYVSAYYVTQATFLLLCLCCHAVFVGRATPHLAKRVNVLSLSSLQADDLHILLISMLLYNIADEYTI